MIKPIFRIAVLSDLHAHNEAEGEPSFLDLREIAVPENLHPMKALRTLLLRDKLAADMLLCPGDLGHQASTLGIEYARRELQTLGALLGAATITATAGNHDMDSRHLHSEFAADRNLKALNPPFPFPGNLWDRYWARHFAILDDESCKLVVLNSSAYHGNTPNEKNHGRLDTFTLSQLEAELKMLPKRELNILLCHHHPQQHSELDLGEDDVMKNGQLLLDLLGSGKHGNWLVIHGHKHHPKITYAAGGSSSPVIFAAGSLSARLPLRLGGVARNQFYLIEFSSSDLAEFGLVGKIHSWEYAHGTGWLRANNTGSGLPWECGFGWRANPQLLARRIPALLGSGDTIPWGVVEKEIPELNFLLPQDFHVFEEALIPLRLALQFEQNEPRLLARHT